MNIESVHGLLSTDQERIMTRALAEEQEKRDHVVVYLSGAHAYGFPSPDSDLDLKAIHVARTADLVGLNAPAPTVDRAEILEGVEIDYTSNELGHALSGILAGNGNFIERVLGRTAVQTSPLLAELQPLTTRSLSRRVHRHYRGFAQNQFRFLEREPSAKKLLYVLRTTLTGVHLLENGELEADLTRLMGPYGYGDAAALVSQKRKGERIGLDPKLLERWRPRIDDLFARLDQARERSPLSEAPMNEEEISDWLLDVRRARF